MFALVANLAITILICSSAICVYLYRSRLARLDHSFYRRVPGGVSSLAAARILNSLVFMGGERIHSPLVLKASTIGEFLCYSVGAVLLLQAIVKSLSRVADSAGERDRDYQWKLFHRTIPNLLRADGDLDKGVRTFLAHLYHSFGYDAISIHLLEDGSDSLKLWQSVGMEASWWHPHRQIPVKGSITGAVIDGGRVITVEGANAPPHLKKLLTPLGEVGSFFGCPVKFGEKSMGVLSIYGREPRRFERIEVRILVAAVDQLATVLSFKDCEGKLAAQERKSRLTSRLGEVALSHPALQTGLPGIVTILKDYIPCDYLTLLLIDRSRSDGWRYTASAEGSSLIEKELRAAELGPTLKVLIGEGRSLLLNDCGSDLEELKAIPFASQVTSMVLLPLSFESATGSESVDLRGALICACKTPGDYDQGSLELLRPVSTCAALIAQKDILRQKLKTRHRGLGRLSRRIASDLSPAQSTEHFGQVAEAVVTGLPTTACRVMGFDSRSSSLRPLGSFDRRKDRSPERRSGDISLRESALLRELVASRKAVTLDSISPDPSLADQEHPNLFGEGIKGGLLVPVTSGGEVSGLLAVGERRSPQRRPFAEGDLEFCQAVAHRLAPVLSHPPSERREEAKLLEVVVQTLPDLVFEMRSPLTAILGNCELMLEVENAPIPEPARQRIRTIERSAKKLHHSLETLSGLHASVIPPREEKTYEPEG